MASSRSFLDYVAERAPLVGYAREFAFARWRVALALTLALVKHTPVLAIPAYTAFILDVTVPRRDFAGLALCLLGMVALIAVNITVHPLYILIYSRIRREVALRMRSRLCSRIQQLSFTYHDRAESGRLHSKVMQDVEKLDRLSQVFVDPLIIMVVTALIASAIILVREPYFIAVLGGFVPLTVMIVAFMRRRLEERYHALRLEQEKLNAEVSQMLSMLTLSRAHATEHHDLERIDRRLGNVRDVAIRTDWITNILHSQIWATSQMVSIIVVTFGGLLIIWGRVTPGEVVMYLFFVGMTVGALNGLLSMAPQFYEGNEAMRSVREVLDFPSLEQHEGKPEMGSLTGRVSFRDVWFSYPGSETPVLKSLNLTVEPCQTIALVGASGAGKTTFVKLLLGFYDPIQGDIFIDGTPMRDFDLRSFRRQVGIVTQETFLFNGTIFQNIAHGLEGVSMEDVVVAARQANALEFIEAQPAGFETEIGDRGVRLSGGQKQRLAIARALLRKPRILILDEATSSLDSQSERLVQEALEVLMKDRTTFVIAHRLSTVRNADRILVFDDGRIVEEGRHELLLSQGGVYSRLVELQAVG